LLCGDTCGEKLVGGYYTKIRKDDLMGLGFFGGCYAEILVLKNWW